MQNININHIDSSAFLRISEIVKPPARNKRKPDSRPLIPISRDTWYRGIKSGAYPKAIRLAGGINVWRAGDIKKVLAGTYQADVTEGAE